MRAARERSDWDKAAQLALVIAETQRNPEKKPSSYQLADFHPYLKRQPTGMSITPATIERLKVFTEQR